MANDVEEANTVGRLSHFLGNGSTIIQAIAVDPRHIDDWDLIRIYRLVRFELVNLAILESQCPEWLCFALHLGHRVDS